MQAAEAPSRPVALTYISSDYDEIRIGFTPSTDNGGSQITAIVLEISNFLTTDWVEITSYDN